MKLVVQSGQDTGKEFPLIHVAIVAFSAISVKRHVEQMIGGYAY